ncbi:MAG TPA: hypothetical protein EYG21_01010 [Nitrospinaceae bacterium]|jgi:hypothetical protein|nr:hypothetical protein [Nitrospinaceae bacterium]
MLAGLLFNVISGLVMDKAQDLAHDHVQKMIDDILPDSAKKELDKIIKTDPTHTFATAKDALKGAVEGKLPITLKDGKIMPIELNIKIKYDPSTGSIQVEKAVK